MTKKIPVEKKNLMESWFCCCLDFDTQQNYDFVIVIVSNFTHNEIMIMLCDETRQ